MKLVLIFLVINLFQREFESKKIRDDDDRIIGGKLVKDIKRFPFVASLVYQNGEEFAMLCGGSIIAEHWVLTAAHCLYNFDDYKFYVGYNSTKWAGNIQRHFVDKRHIHERFEYDTTNYDAALVHVAERFPREFIIRMVPSNFQYITNTKVTVLGWGNTKDGQHGAQDYLSYVHITLQSWKACERYQIMRNNMFTRIMFCAGDEGKTGCEGDSGGAVYQMYKKQKMIIGVVSWGTSPCADSKYGGVYAKVAAVTEWIKPYIRSGNATIKKNRKYY